MKVLTLASVALALLAAQESFAAAGHASCQERYHEGSADRLPETLDAPGDANARGALAQWTVESIVETRRITGVALSRQGRAVGFIVKQSFVDSGAIRYGLYSVGFEAGGRATKLAESPYMHSLAARPGTGSWTVLAEFGCGVQLYEATAARPLRPILVNSDLVTSGTEGVVPSAADGAHRIGIKAYEWAPDGMTFWYSRLRLKAAKDRDALANDGIVFEPLRVFLPFNDKTALLAGTELHVARADGGGDRQVAFTSADESLGSDPFGPTSTHWSADSRRIEVFAMALQPNGQSEMSRSSIDPASGERKPMADRKLPPLEMYYGIALPGSGGYLTLRMLADGRHLVELDAAGSVAHDFGPVSFAGVGGPFPAWWDESGRRGVFTVRYRDREGLVTFPELREVIASAEDGSAESLETCAFTRDLQRGACVRESLTTAPELVAVEPGRGVTSVLARPNRPIEPLRSVRKAWPNKYGTEGDGYVTYPRNYTPGTKLPVMVVTHGSDAGNRFAYDGFQWEYPVQVFAEHGYLVLSVNEPAITPRKQAAMDAWAKLSSNVAADQMQFAAAYEAVATMEAALQWAIDEGLADPARAGIAGYSRGSTVVKFVLSQSKLFKAGSGGDAAWFSASSYWDGISRNLYLAIFGGSPFDPKALDNYRKLSPSFRTHDFSGPLLQEFTVRSAYSGVELDTLLREAGIPTELVFYLDETHIPWHPKRRASSMRLNFDWFNFWLLGTEDAAPEKAARYARWRAMREKWNATGDREAPRDRRGG